MRRPTGRSRADGSPGKASGKVCTGKKATSHARREAALPASTPDGLVTHGEHRARQLCAARILEEMTSPLAKCHPRLWSKRAYWLLVGIIYERLTLAPDEIGTDELMKLSKALAEPRRSESRRVERRGRLTASTATPGAGLENMRRLVQRVYGVSIAPEQSSKG